MTPCLPQSYRLCDLPSPALQDLKAAIQINKLDSLALARLADDGGGCAIADTVAMFPEVSKPDAEFMRMFRNAHAMRVTSYAGNERIEQLKRLATAGFFVQDNTLPDRYNRSLLLVRWNEQDRAVVK